MSEQVFKLPDLGEGTVEAEIVAWHVSPGDVVEEGQHVVDVTTDKATVEVPAPFSGRVLRTSGSPGETVAVGAELMAVEVAGDGTVATPEAPAPEPAIPAPAPQEAAVVEPAPAAVPSAEPAPQAAPEAVPESVAEPAAESVPEPGPALVPVPAPDVAAQAARPITSPSIRRRARETGVDLALVPATGPRGRILMRDLEAYLGAQGAGVTARPAAPVSDVEEIKVIGVRRVIAERMSQSKREIPHFAYVEEVDVDALEELRRHLNAKHEASLSVLPFVALAVVRALVRYPQCNAHFDAEAGVIRRHRSVHLGVATQTPDGLKVPVVREAGSLDLWRLAAEIHRVAEAARSGKATRAELSGSTITITSLGRIAGIASTPVINHPEVAIVGINRVAEQAVVRGGQLCARRMMNLSSSFDHRFVDGFDAASFVQEIKERLEHPAALFIGDP